jgi:D-amino-acid dehydrogenase
MSKSVTILGAGVIGLSTALYCARRGMKVTIIDQKPRQRDGCSFGNAGMIVPSHFIPLAAPGMVAGPEMDVEPGIALLHQTRLDLDLMSWGLVSGKRPRRPCRCRRACFARFEPAEPQCFEEIGLDFGLVKRGLLMLCKKQQTLDEEAHMAEMANRSASPPRCWMRKPPPRSIPR